MRKTLLLLTILVALARGAGAQEQEAKYIADTVTVQADATYEADPDLATLSFQVSVTEKELRKADRRLRRRPRIHLRRSVSALQFIAFSRSRKSRTHFKT